jgi:uncharacterized protein YkwD
MLKSALFAGLFWAAVNTVSAPTAAAPAPAKAPVLMASAPRPAASAKAHLRLEMPTPSDAASPADALSPEEQEFVARVNAERTARGLNALAVDPLLVRTARAHSREMCDRGYFDHHSPTPGLTSPMDRYLHSLREDGGRTPDYLLVGENIYYCSVFNDVYNVDYGHRALMDSPGHRANILEPRFTKIGLGVHRSAKGEFWVTEMFTRDSQG